MDNIVGNIISGILASILAVILIKCINTIKERKFYNKIVGKYKVYTIDNKEVENEIVTLTYHGDRLIKAHSKFNYADHWKSDIVMNISNKFHGEGVYSHINYKGFGLHSILLSPDCKDISVHFRSLCNINGGYGGVFWKKLEP